MPRPPRAETPIGLFHVTARCNLPGELFPLPGDRLDFLCRLDQVVRKFELRIGAYALMGTHYHLLVATGSKNLATAMHWLHQGYAKDLNKRHGRAGHVLRDRYRAPLVETDPHALEAVRYIALNPVRAGLVTHPLDWPWGSYPAMMGHAPQPAFLDARLVLDLFGGNGIAEQRGRLGRFVDDALAGMLVALP